ncbi:hypothetical protein [Pseudogemmobacter bohemicus]|uniref:hypothetical protein n=1 Tax=Pseudogemmobacter bohemicus TaxID=2250708 RepID=UPI001E575775|nr:hypothetical protein [Pseudogemmobacter bohemicus]
MSLFSQLPGAWRHLVVVSLLAEVDDPAADKPVTLCHYPMMTWNHARQGALHLFGHVHGNWQGTANSVNVDVWGYYRCLCQMLRVGQSSCRRTGTGKMASRVPERGQTSRAKGGMR